MAITFEAYARNNGAFRASRPMPGGVPMGIVVHSTGANNPNLKRYVNAPEVCGENIYKNYFDRADSDVCQHAVIGKDKNGIVRAAKILPWNVCCWGCGSGSKGSYNFSPAYIQFEICEDALNDRAYFEEAFGLAAQLCQRLMRNYPSIKLENIISHKEACARGYASNHGDPENWLVRFGKDMDWFRSLIGGSKVRVTAEKVVPEASAAIAVSQLKSLGFNTSVKKI